MKVKIEAGRARGRIRIPPSKSMAHRLLICAAMCEGVSTVKGISDCEDVLATLDCISALGIRSEICGGDVKIYGKSFKDVTPTGALPCRESGSTLRFMIPPALLCGKTCVFYGAQGLMRRPMDVYEKFCGENGLTFISDGGSIAVKGPLKGGDYEMVGNISSQFISGLLFALPCAEGDSRIRIVTPIESRSYIDMTIAALKIFGVEVLWDDDHTLFIRGSQKYTATEAEVEGDYSGAAFPEALSLFGGEVEVEGLNPDSIQGDRVYKKYFELLEAGIPSIHIGDCPDLGPILFAVAAGKCGGIFSGTKRLKIKESDRATAMAEELKKFGASVSVYEDSVTVYPKDLHAPSELLCGHNDHRIVMALAILASVTGGVIDGAEAVSKSYPDFFNDLRALGIEVSEYDT